MTAPDHEQAERIARRVEEAAGQDRLTGSEELAIAVAYRDLAAQLAEAQERVKNYERYVRRYVDGVLITKLDLQEAEIRRLRRAYAEACGISTDPIPEADLIRAKDFVREQGWTSADQDNDEVERVEDRARAAPGGKA